jgi:hypothetical protein
MRKLRIAGAGTRTYRSVSRMSQMRTMRTTKPAKSELPYATRQARMAILLKRLAEDLERLESDVETERDLIEGSKTFAASGDRARRLSGRLELTVEAMRDALAELQAIRESDAADHGFVAAGLADAGG